MEYLRARGHLLAMYWWYITLVTLNALSFSLQCSCWTSGCSARSYGGRECSPYSILLQCLSLRCCSLWCSVLLPFICNCGFLLCKSLLVSFSLGLRPICNAIFLFSVACHCCVKLRLRCCWLCSFVVIGFGDSYEQFAVSDSLSVRLFDILP